MPTPLHGVHHVTAFARHPRETHDFYTRTLGLRLVKKTVNFDDPLTYHLYFGDETGSPGTLLTHFPHPNAKRGTHGSPEIAETVLAIPAGTLGVWRDRLHVAGIATTTRTLFDEQRLCFDDPHGMRLALVETGQSDHDAILRVESVRIETTDAQATGAFLRDTLGFNDAGSSNGVQRFRASPAGGTVELAHTPELPVSVMGAGAVHHVAWRVPDDASQIRVRDLLRDAGVAVTPVLDRKYFKSIYFRVPGGVIFEVATDGPGFTVDEPAGSLGESLQLPEQYEPRRVEIERHLLPLDASR